MTSQQYQTGCKNHETHHSTRYVCPTLLMRCTGFWPRRFFSFAVRPHTEFSPPSFFKVRLQDRNYQSKSEQDNNCCRCDKAGNRALLAPLVIVVELCFLKIAPATAGMARKKERNASQKLPVSCSGVSRIEPSIFSLQAAFRQFLHPQEH